MSAPHFLDGWKTGTWPSHWDRPTLDRLRKCHHTRTFLGSLFERDSESACQILEACLEAKWKWKQLPPGVTPKAAEIKSARAARCFEQLARYLVKHDDELRSHNRLLHSLSVGFHGKYDETSPTMTMAQALSEYARQLQIDARWEGSPDLPGKPSRNTAFRTLAMKELILALARSNAAVTDQQLVDLANIVVNDPDPEFMLTADDVRKQKQSMQRRGTLS